MGYELDSLHHFFFSEKQKYMLLSNGGSNLEKKAIGKVKRFLTLFFDTSVLVWFSGVPFSAKTRPLQEFYFSAVWLIYE